MGLDQVMGVEVREEEERVGGWKAEGEKERNEWKKGLGGWRVSKRASQRATEKRQMAVEWVH